MLLIFLINFSPFFSNLKKSIDVITERVRACACMCIVSACAAFNCVRAFSRIRACVYACMRVFSLACVRLRTNASSCVRMGALASVCSRMVGVYACAFPCASARMRACFFTDVQQCPVIDK